MEKEKEDKRTMFDKLYDGAAALIKEMNKPLARKNVKRKLRAGWDKAQAAIDKNKLAIQKEIMKVTEADLEKCLEYKADIRNHKEAQEDIAEIYMDLFGEKFDPDVE